MNFGHDITGKSFIKYIVIIVIIGFVLTAYDYYSTQIDFNGKYERSKTGEGTIFDSLVVDSPLGSGKVDFSLSEQSLSKEDAKLLLAQAVDEINASVLGENTSFDRVLHNLCLKNDYCDKKVTAKWYFDNYTIISTEGEIYTDRVAPEGNVVNAQVDLCAGGQDCIYEFSFVVFPYQDNSLSGFLSGLSKALQENQESRTADSTYSLPTSYRGMNLIWKKQMDYRGLWIIVLGITALILIRLSVFYDRKKEKDVRQAQLLRDYPAVINNLSILMGAGISFRQSVERICQRYQAAKEKEEGVMRPGFEELVICRQQMKDGVGELAAIENLGIRAGQKDYRKLCMLLCQNLRKGSVDLLYMLEKEDNLGFELRKQLALKAGEEASTKLLLPMMGMLGLVMVILIVPALLSMNL